MSHLYQRVASLVDGWRNADYPVERFAAISEILEWAGETETGDLRFLRRPQLRALEAYWYLRLVESTPHVFELYQRHFDTTAELIAGLGVPDRAFKEADYDLNGLWERLRRDDEFVRSHRLESLRETLALDYPSYILALAMGAGKTVLIGAIIATEFAMAAEYHDGPFVQNALVFAPGKTILSALRELSDVPYDRILPPRLYKGFAASVKLTFTRDGERDIPVVRGSLFNIVVTNTEKIRIRSETVRKSDLGQLRLAGSGLEEARREVANLRLQAIASLPHLAVFSDEAHHTYGQPLKVLKKVRMTVDYVAENTNVVCVVNTTGTPYFKRQPLKDVVVWYSLAQGIADGILKEVSGNIRSYEFEEADDAFVRHVVNDFFEDYGDVRLPNGAPAKLAMYFPQTDDLKRLRPAVDEALLSRGLSPTLALVNTSDSTLTSQTDIDAFERLNDPAAPHRLMLLVNKGTEGWNCPSLFGCALARRLTTSNNFVLQAASRCLRQVPGNTAKARIYLSADNYGILDRQLAETYGETIQDLEGGSRARQMLRLVLRKKDVPPLIVRKVQHSVVRRQNGPATLHLTRPKVARKGLTERRYGFGEGLIGRRVLQQIAETIEVEAIPDDVGVYEAAAELAATYALDVWTVYDELRRLYGTKDVPAHHLSALAHELEEQLIGYEVREEEVEVALAIVRHEGFRRESDETGAPIYTAEIVYPKDKEDLLVRMTAWAKENPGDFAFHYDPYDFDSLPERNFLYQALRIANVNPDQIEDVYFTGGITDPAKTDFWVEYQDAKGKWRRYTPDFIIRKKPDDGGPPGSGKVLIVEVKAPQFASDVKAAAGRKLEDLNPDRIKYEIVFTSKSEVPPDAMRLVHDFIGAATSDGSRLRIPVNRSEVEAFCRKWKIAELSFFGSVLTDEFGPNSDVDVLVTFDADARWGLEIVAMEDELTRIIGREVQLVERSSVESSHNWIRREAILDGAEPFLVAR
ncbi:MAG: nucleotidyltransferase domain-containing protein [Actinomycetota bacterium]